MTSPDGLPPEPALAATCVVCDEPVRPPAFPGDRDPLHVGCRAATLQEAAVDLTERARLARDRAMRIVQSVKEERLGRQQGP